MKPTLRLDRVIDLTGRVSEWRAYLVGDKPSEGRDVMHGYGPTPLDAISQLAVNLGAMFPERKK